MLPRIINVGSHFWDLSSNTKELASRIPPKKEKGKKTAKEKNKARSKTIHAQSNENPKVKLKSKEEKRKKCHKPKIKRYEPDMNKSKEQNENLDLIWQRYAATAARHKVRTKPPKDMGPTHKKPINYKKIFACKFVKNKKNNRKRSYSEIWQYSYVDHLQASQTLLTSVQQYCPCKYYPSQLQVACIE